MFPIHNSQNGFHSFNYSKVLFKKGRCYYSDLKFFLNASFWGKKSANLQFSLKKSQRLKKGGHSCESKQTLNIENADFGRNQNLAKCLIYLVANIIHL